MNEKEYASAPGQEYTPQQIVAIGRKVTWVGFWINAALGVVKVLAGIFGRSSAMVADGIHSFSDFISDVIVIVMLGLSHKKADNTFQYGRGKYETLATLFIALLLAAVAIGIFYEGVEKIITYANGGSLGRPTWLALSMAILSIAAKEGLFHYTRYWGRKIHSGSVIANAWHHRSDSISSAATLLGIAGAMFLGENWRILDPMAAVVVSVFIMMMAVKIGLPSMRELLETSLPADMVRDIRRLIYETPGVVTYHHLQTRRSGNLLLGDVHIKVDPDITVCEGHEISTNVETRLREHFGKDIYVNIHVEPYKGEEIRADGSCED